MAKQATLANIAKKSKVSVSTVSLVLRDKPGIPDATRQRVRAAARALGYSSKRRVTGSSPRVPKQKLSTLGLVLKSEPDVPPQSNPFYSYVLAGIEAACRRNHINLLYATLPVDADNVPVETPRVLEEDNVDGLLLVGAFVGDALDQILRAKLVPVVLVDAYAAPDSYDAVLSDNASGAYRAVSYLIERGHEHIAFLGTRLNAYPSLQQRREGYERALQTHGLPHRYYADTTFSRADIVRATTQLLEQHPEITALFAMNDEAGITAMGVAQGLGRRVPDDLSIIGFDNIDMAESVMPGLTTMHVDKLGMGRIAVNLLADRVQFAESEKVTTFLKPRLIERASVRDHKPQNRT